MAKNISKFRVEIDPKHCKACYLCVEFCPKGVLSISKSGVNKDGVPITEYLPEGHEGREAYGIVKDHEGTIRLENRPGDGATFLIDLPLPNAQQVLEAAT